MLAYRVAEFVNEFRDLARTAANEEELRNAFGAAVVNKLGIRDLKMERLRQDARRNKVIIEFKGKGLFGGSDRSATFLQARKQLLGTYIPRQANVDGAQQHDYVGVLFDGEHLAFAFVEANGNWRTTDLRPFDDRSAGTLVLALEEDIRRELTADNIADDFGPTSAIAHGVLNALWRHLDSSLSAPPNRVQMLFAEWKDLFEQSAGLGTLGKAQLSQYLGTLGIPAGAELSRVLFVLHTYHALFFKLLAAELVLANSLLTRYPESVRRW